MASRMRSPAGSRWPRAGTQGSWRYSYVFAIEVVALAAAGLVLIIAALGQAAGRLTGTGLLSSLLPFASVVLVLALSTTVLLWMWRSLRRRLVVSSPYLPAASAASIALGTALFAAKGTFEQDFRNFRSLVGGPAEAERSTVSHQVFAAYRRADLHEFQRMWERSRTYLPVIRQAAATYGVDEDVLVGIGAAESSFRPRDSKDGGRGLFQITFPPKVAVALAKKDLNTASLDFRDHRHNAYLAAATLKHYLGQMRGDLFLGLLAYNIGPQNGGLQSIMSQYRARDFVTVQPYLKDLPRDYPVRVLTAALAYRLWRIEGRLPRYEEGNNAARIQGVGIPGLG